LIFGLTNWISQRVKLTDKSGKIFGRGDDCTRPVNTETALTISAVFACVRLISQSIAALPCGVFSLDTYGDKILERDNPLYKILRRSPNADMTAFTFFCAFIACRLLWGNAYALKTFRGSGKNRALVSLELLHPALMSLRENKDGSVTYIYQDRLGRNEYTEDEIFHHKGFTINGRTGLSVISYANQSFGISLDQESTTSKIYSRGMQKTGILKVEKTLTNEQRQLFKDNIAAQFGNLTKNGGTLVLEGGMTFEALGLTPEDAELIASRSFSIEEVCRWFGVPPVLIGHSANTTMWGTGVEQINLGFLTYTIHPIIKSLEQEMARSLIPSEQKDDLFCEFNIDAFLRADSSGRAALYASASQNGWMDRAEIRRKENLPYKAGSEELTVQSALVNLKDLDKIPRGTATTPAPANNGDQKTILNIKDMTIPHVDDPEKV
jgi:HK97 family phage portal protein